MPYTTHTTVEALVAMYDAIHAHVLDTTKGTIDGLLVHLARPTPTGFEVFEVWESPRTLRQILAGLARTRFRCSRH